MLSLRLKKLSEYDTATHYNMIWITLFDSQNKSNLPAMNRISNRWFQLTLSVIVLVIISGPQYLWALFVKSLLAKFDVPLSELQVVFSLVVVCMTFITPAAGYLHDKFNSRNIIAVGLLMCSGSWVLASYANSLLMLYLTYGILGGLGAGIAFIGVTGLVQKCFPDQRGLATGILMSGYALGPLLTTYAVSKSVDVNGVENTWHFFGVMFVLIGLIVVSGIRKREQINVPKTGTQRLNVDGVNSAQMLSSAAFWLMFFIMMTIAASGMMVTSNIAIIAQESGIGSQVIMFGMAALPLALMLDRITNGLSRILFGYISDKLGRENTLALAFALEACFVLLWFSYSHDPILFILLSGLVFLAWGEIFSIFPALCTDTFGEKNASVNFGFLYASVGVGAIIGGPLAALLRESTGDWSAVIHLIVLLDSLAALLAVTLLKRFVAKQKEKGHFTGLDLQNSAQATQSA